MEIKRDINSVTITTIFMVPTLKIKDLEKNNFINAYIEDSGREVQYEDACYLLFKPEDVDMFREFLDGEYERTRNIIDDYDYEGGFVVVVYKLSPLFKKDFELIKQGKYSATSVEFQEQFPKTKRLIIGNLHKDELSLAYRIFNRADDLRDFWEKKLGVDFSNEMELWGGFDIEKEKLTINNMKEYA